MRSSLRSYALTTAVIFILGFICLMGIHEANADSYKNIRKSAEQGDAAAQHELGVMYAEGKGVDQDDMEAVKWFKKAVGQRYAKSQVMMGMLHVTDDVIPQDDKEAAKWFRKAAEQGNAEGQALLGMMYEKGIGVPQDYIKAYAWCKLAIPGYPVAKACCEMYEKEMTPQQIALAKDLSSQLQNKINNNSQ